MPTWRPYWVIYAGQIRGPPLSAMLAHRADQAVQPKSSRIADSTDGRVWLSRTATTKRATRPMRALADKYSKPLSVRFISEGRSRIGDRTVFDQEYLKDAVIRPISSRKQGGVMTGDLAGEAAELLQALIRNGCVNDGTAGSGQEERNADTLAAYLDGSGVGLQRYQPQPGRTSLVARLDGSDRSAPSLLLMGHTDVVPATASRWRHDPFGGELIDGEIWGRGAIDMLDVTATMAVAFRRLASSGWRHRGTLIYLAVADEEAGGTFGARWLVEHVPDAVGAEYVLTELGGARLPPLGAGPPRRAVQVAEKSPFVCTLRYPGTPGHASVPYGADNALLKAAQAACRLAVGPPGPQITSAWEQFVTSLGLAGELAEALLDPARVDALLPALDTGLARVVHACTRCTIAPTLLQAGVKANVIPEQAALTLDIRALPGWDENKIRTMLAGALGDLWDDADAEIFDGGASAPSPVNTPLWASLQRAADRLAPGDQNIPVLIPGVTDGRFFRRLGATTYGYQLFSDRIGFDQMVAMFHGDNERVDLETLRLSTELWLFVARDLLS